MDTNNYHHSEFEQTSVDEELVAYLDGELDAEIAGCVEARLAVDGEYRRRMQQLDRTWNCLDRLPRATVDENFTRTTVEMASACAAEEIAARHAAIPVRRRIRTLLTAAAMLFLLLVGFVGASVFLPDPNAKILADLSVLVNLDPLLQINDVEVLRKLAAENIFDDDDSDVAFFTSPLPDSAADRRKWLSSLSRAEKAELARNRERFDTLPAEKQTQLRQVERTIDSSSNAAELEVVLARYYQWLKGLAPYQRADLLALPSSDRVAKIKQIRAEQEQREARQLALADQRVILARLAEIAGRHREELLKNIPKDDSKNGRNPRNHWVGRNFEGRDEKQRSELLTMLLAGQLAAERVKLTDDDWKLLTSADKLSPNAAKRLEKAATVEDKREVAVAWINVAARQRMGSRGFGRSVPEVNQEDLEKFFEVELSNREKWGDRREQLLAMPSDEMQRELRRLYFQVNIPGGASGEWPRRWDGDRRRPDRGQNWRPGNGSQGPPRQAPRQDEEERDGQRGEGRPRRHPGGEESRPPHPHLPFGGDRGREAQREGRPFRTPQTPEPSNGQKHPAINND